MLRIDIELDTAAFAAELRKLIETDIPRRRREQTEEFSQSVTADAASGTPVETGRARRGWSEASNENTTAMTDTRTQSSVSVTNRVPYINHLEFGTRRMSPLAMARRALQSARGRLAQTFRLLGD